MIMTLPIYERESVHGHKFLKGIMGDNMDESLNMKEKRGNLMQKKHWRKHF